MGGVILLLFAFLRPLSAQNPAGLDEIFQDPVFLSFFTSEGACSGDPLSSCTPISAGSFEIELPDYPGCVVTAGFGFQVCAGTSVFTNLTLGIELSPQCSGLTSDFFANINQNTLQAQDFFAAIWAQAQEEVAMEFYQGIVDATSDLDLLTCGNQTTAITLGFYQGSCANYCIGFINEAFVITQSQCGDVCCEKRIEICLDPETGERVVSQSSEVLEGESCFDNPTDCPLELPLSSPCFDNCTK